MATCVRCGGQLPSEAQFCSACGTPAAPDNPFAERAANPYSSPANVPPPPGPTGNVDPVLSWIVPINTPILAVVSSYCGLLSLVFCFLGPVAIITGIMAIRKINRTPGLVGMGRCIAGIALGSLGCLLLLFVLGGIVLEGIRR